MLLSQIIGSKLWEHDEILHGMLLVRLYEATAGFSVPNGLALFNIFNLYKHIKYIWLPDFKVGYTNFLYSFSLTESVSLIFSILSIVFRIS